MATASLFLLSRLWFSFGGAREEAVLWAVSPNEPKARGLVPPGWLVESDPAGVILSEVGSAIFLGGALSLECYLFYTSASARSQRFQICQCAKRYSAITEASARRYPPPTPQIFERL